MAFTEEQARWLDKIAEHIATSLVIEMDDYVFDEYIMPYDAYFAYVAGMSCQGLIQKIDYSS